MFRDGEIQQERVADADRGAAPASPSTVSADHLETAASVMIGPISYRARCTEAGCKNLGRMLMIYPDAGGRPIAHPVVCHKRARWRLARNRATGLKVYDDHEAS
jgi:hypothetical protein